MSRPTTVDARGRCPVCLRYVSPEVRRWHHMACQGEPKPFTGVSRTAQEPRTQQQPVSVPRRLVAAPEPRWQWPEGYRRRKGAIATVWQALVLIGVIACQAAWFHPSNIVVAPLAIVTGAVAIAWVEWAERCEDRRKVLIVGVALTVALLLLGHYRHNKGRR